MKVLILSQSNVTTGLSESVYQNNDHCSNKRSWNWCSSKQIKTDIY